MMRIRKLVLGIGFSVSAAITAGCDARGNEPPQPPTSPPVSATAPSTQPATGQLTLSEANRGQTIPLHPGDDLAVVLHSTY